jgi:cell division protein FtsZ
MGVAMMGTGTADGDGRAMHAAQRAVSSPLLEDSSVTGARGVIINVTGGPDMSLMEVNEASSVIQESAHEDANIIFGAVIDPDLTGKIKITVIATGFDRKGSHRTISTAAVQTPVDLTNYTAHLARADAERAEPAVQTKAAAQSGSQAASLTLNRRPALELSLPPANGGGGHESMEVNGLDLSSPLDVPAFLRRQN